MQEPPAQMVEDPLLEDKLQKRAKNLAACLKTFVGAYQSAQHQNQQHAAAAKGKGALKAAINAATVKSKPAASAKGGKGGKAQKDPKAEAWGALLLELDERISKSKKYNLEDMYRAVASLECLERQALGNIIATTSSKLLPEKQNEAALAIRHTLYAAAAAHNYQEQQVPEASREGASAFRQRGLPADCALNAGFHAGQLLRAGYSIAELVQSSTPDLQHIRAAGISVRDLYANLPADKAASMSGVAGAKQLKDAGYTALAVQSGAPEGFITTWDLRLAGYTSGGSTMAVAGGGVAAAESRRLGARSRTRTNSVTGAAAAGGAAAQQQDASSAATGGGANSSLQQQQRQQQTEMLRADGPGDVEYFRHGLKPLMHMQPGIDLPDLLVGTKDKLLVAGKLDAIEDAPATIMLAANPVKLAQQRKRSATGAAALSVQLPAGSGSTSGPATSAARVKQGLDRQATSRLNL